MICRDCENEYTEEFMIEVNYCVFCWEHKIDEQLEKWKDTLDWLAKH